MPIPGKTYQEWIQRFDTFDAEELRAATEYGRSLVPDRTFDVVMPVHDPPPDFLEAAITSIKLQTYDNWRLCIVDDGSKLLEVRRLLERAAAEDGRIRLLRSEAQTGIARATNLALAMGSADFVAFLDHDDVLPPHALVTIADWLIRAPNANLLYSDFDFIDREGIRDNPFFKPDYDHDLHLGLNMVTHLTVYRRSVLDKLDGLREGFEGSEDYDLSLRAVESCNQDSIVHVPHVLYHWRIVPTSFSRTKTAAAVDSARRAVHEHCLRIGIPSTIGGTARSLIWNRVRAVPAVPLTATVAVEGVSVETSADRVSRLHAHTDYIQASFLGTGKPSLGSVRNAVLRDADTDLVAFVSGLVFPRGRDWLTEMASHFAHPATGVVGPRVVAGDGKVRQSGIVLGVGPHLDGISLAPAFAGVPDAEANYFGCAEIAHRVSALSGGVLVVRKSAVSRVGGFDEAISSPTLLDVDLCLRLGAADCSVVVCPYAVFEAADEDPADPPPRIDSERIRGRWSAALEADPYYNPNLSALAADYGLGFPPRVRFPWQRAMSKER